MKRERQRERILKPLTARRILAERSRKKVSRGNRYRRAAPFLTRLISLADSRGINTFSGSAKRGCSARSVKASKKASPGIRQWRSSLLIFIGTFARRTKNKFPPRKWFDEHRRVRFPCDMHLSLSLSLFLIFTAIFLFSDNSPIPNSIRRHSLSMLEQIAKISPTSLSLQQWLR